MMSGAQKLVFPRAERSRTGVLVPEETVPGLNPSFRATVTMYSLIASFRPRPYCPARNAGTR